MDLNKVYSRRSFAIIMLMMLVLLIALSGFFYYFLQLFISGLTPAGHGSQASVQIVDFLKQAMVFFVPIAAAILVLMGLVLWLVLRQLFVRLQQKSVPRKKPAFGTESRKSHQKRQIIDQRLMLHLISMLQREGRLVDFFGEDLTPYNDEQIGVAVRSVHENCKRIFNACLAPEPIIDIPEGEAYTVSKNFDPETVKLIGNVSGEPPFEGVVRHRGWQAGKLELPTLSSSRNPRVIFPAEVEIT